MVKKYSREEYKNIAAEHPEDVKAILREDMNFTETGILEMYEEKVEKCSEFYAKLLGGDKFDPQNVGHVTRLLEAGVRDADSMADVCEFIYDNFNDDDIATEPGKDSEAVNQVVGSSQLQAETKPKEQKQRAPGKPRKTLNWAAMDVPFKEGTKMHVLFKRMLTFTGTKKEFVVEGERLLREGGFSQPELAKHLTETTLVYAKKRGWGVKLLDEKITLTRPVVHVPTSAE